MIPAENREENPHFAWLPADHALPVVAQLALHLGESPPVQIEGPLVASPRGTWWIAPSDLADGEVTRGDILMQNKTIRTDAPGVPAVKLPSVYRLVRALEHAVQNDVGGARYFEDVSVALAREIVRSQLLESDDGAGQTQYQLRLAVLFDAAKRRLGHSSKRRDRRLLAKLERAGSLTDSLGRFNRCALPLVIRLVQRLASAKAKDQRMRALDTGVAATSLEEAVARLEARTEWVATHLIQLARSPGLQAARWVRAKPRERSTFKRRIRVALQSTLPELERRLTEWTLPEPFRTSYREAMAHLTRGTDLLRVFHEDLERKSAGEGFHQTAAIREEFAKAAQALAKALLVPIIHDFLFPIAIAIRAAESDESALSELLESVGRDALQNVPLALDAIAGLEEAFGKDFENTGFQTSVAAAKRMINDARRQLSAHRARAAYEGLRAAEFLIAA